MSQLSEDCFPMFGLLGTSLKMRFRIERGSKQKNALTASGLTCFSLFMLLKAQISLLWKKKKISTSRALPGSFASNTATVKERWVSKAPTNVLPSWLKNQKKKEKKFSSCTIRKILSLYLSQ